MLGRRRFLQSSLAVSGIGVLAGCGVAPPWGQTTAKVPRIGFLLATSVAVEATRVEAFRLGLHDLGYEEGWNIVIDWRRAEGQSDQLPHLAVELVRLGVDVIVSGGAAYEPLQGRRTRPGVYGVARPCASGRAGRCRP